MPLPARPPILQPACGPSARQVGALVALAIAGLAPLLPAPLQAQAMVLQPPPQNVLNLSAEASREVAQDLMGITLALVREGSDAAAVQAQLRQALEAALAEARPAVRPGQLELRTGGFSLSPRYAAKPGAAPTIQGWLGRAELVLEGRDTLAIGQLAGRLGGLTVARVGFALSREVREKAQAEVSAQAIARFKAAAEAHAQQFGFGSYSLREVSINAGEMAPPSAAPMFRAQAMATRAGAEEAQPVEPGRTTVTVTVSGSIQLSPR